MVADGCHLAVEFQDLNGPDFSYTLRMDNVPGGPSEKKTLFALPRSWKTEFTFPALSLNMGPRGISIRDNSRHAHILQGGGKTPGYEKYQFVQWEHAINRALLARRINKTTGNAEKVTKVTEAIDRVQLQRFPWPAYNRDIFTFAIEFGFPTLLMLALLFTVLSIARSVTHEKEKRLKESMKMMGLKSATHWVSAGYPISVGPACLALVCRYACKGPPLTRFGWRPLSLHVW